MLIRNGVLAVIVCTTITTASAMQVKEQQAAPVAVSDSSRDLPKLPIDKFTMRFLRPKEIGLGVVSDASDNFKVDRQTSRVDVSQAYLERHGAFEALRGAMAAYLGTDRVERNLACLLYTGVTGMNLIITLMNPPLGMPTAVTSYLLINYKDKIINAEPMCWRSIFNICVTARQFDVLNDHFIRNFEKLMDGEDAHARSECNRVQEAFQEIGYQIHAVENGSSATYQIKDNKDVVVATRTVEYDVYEDEPESEEEC